MLSDYRSMSANLNVFVSVIFFVLFNLKGYEEEAPLEKSEWTPRMAKMGRGMIDCKSKYGPILLLNVMWRLKKIPGMNLKNEIGFHCV